MLLLTASYLEPGVARNGLAPPKRLFVHLKNPGSVGTSDTIRSTPIPLTQSTPQKISPPVAKKTSDTASLPISEETTPKTYFDPNDVDEVAFVLSVPELPLPTNEETVTGSVQIKVFIDAIGIPDEIEIVESTLPDYYVTSLTNAFSKARFQPAMRGGVAVNSWRVIEITYADGEPPPVEDSSAKENR